jgi:hypothetical protein
MITLYVPLVLKENLEKVGNPRHKKSVGNEFVSARQAESAKSADFWLSGRHVADMSATFPAKVCRWIQQPEPPLMSEGHVIQYCMTDFTRTSLAVNLHTFVILIIMPNTAKKRPPRY